MSEYYPPIIKNLPKANVPFEKASIFLPIKKKHQVVFMEFSEDTHIPEHTHSDQAEFVLSGKIDTLIDGKKETFTKGDCFYIPVDTPHSAKAYAGYTAIGFFAEPKRFVSQ